MEVAAKYKALASQLRKHVLSLTKYAARLLRTP